MTDNKMNSTSMDVTKNEYITINNDSVSDKDNTGKEKEENGNEKHRKRERFKKRKKRKVSFDALEECRKMFRHEMIVLAKEVEQFRIVCDAQIDKYQKMVQEEKNAYNKSHKDGLENGRIVKEDKMDEMWKDQLNNLQSDMEYLERKQLLLDKEQKLIVKEDELSKRERDLEDYEQEIEDVEGLLDKRQAMCDKRQRDLDDLDEDLRTLKGQLKEEKEKFENSGVNVDDVSSERAKRNWEKIRNKLVEKQTDLEGIVQRYKTDLVTANSNIASKDLQIGKLYAQIKTITLELQQKDKKIKQLESRLTLTMDEARHLQMQHETENNIEHNGYKNSTDSLDSSFSRRHGSFKRQISRRAINNSLPDKGRGHRHDSFLDNGRYNHHSIHGHEAKQSGKLVQRQNSDRTDSNVSSASEKVLSRSCSIM